MIGLEIIILLWWSIVGLFAFTLVGELEGPENIGWVLFWILVVMSGPAVWAVAATIFFKK